MYYKGCQCNLSVTWISFQRYIIWLRAICIFVTRAREDRGDLSEKAISTLARQIHHVFSGTLCVWVCVCGGRLLFRVSYCMSDLARQSDPQWLDSPLPLLFNVIPFSNRSPRPSLWDSRFHLCFISPRPLAMFPVFVIVRGIRIFTFVCYLCQQSGIFY